MRLFNTQSHLVFIEGKSEVDIKTIAYDFSKTDEYDDIAEKIKDLDVGILGG